MFGIHQPTITQERYITILYCIDTKGVMIIPGCTYSYYTIYNTEMNYILPIMVCCYVMWPCTLFKYFHDSMHAPF
jgi:hypothetical protein